MTLLPLRTEMRCAAFIGRGEYDRALDILNEGLASARSDADAQEFLDRIALCHHGAGRETEAIEALMRALERNPSSFFSLKFLSQIHYSRREHDDAANFARRAMEVYPEPLPQVPNFVLRIYRGLARLFPKYREIFEDVEKNVSAPMRDDREWYGWAKEYLKWYDASRGTSLAPRLH